MSESTRICPKCQAVMGGIRCLQCALRINRNDRKIVNRDEFLKNKLPALNWVYCSALSEPTMCTCSRWIQNPNKINFWNHVNKHHKFEIEQSYASQGPQPSSTVIVELHEDNNWVVDPRLYLCREDACEPPNNS